MCSVVNTQELIRYNSGPSFADLILDLPYHDYMGYGATPVWSASIQSLDFSVAPYAKIFCKTDFLKKFAHYFAAIKTPIHLITGVSDMNPLDIDGCDAIVGNQNIWSWIGNNLPVVNGKMMTLPIGFREDSRGLIQLPKMPNVKKNAVIMTHHGPTVSSREGIETNSGGPLIKQEKKLPPNEYLSLLGDYRYSLCLQGNGMDTHRVYESLVMSSIPVVLRSPLDFLYRSLGAIIIETLDEIDNHFLEKYCNHRLPDLNRLRLGYWRDIVMDFQLARQ